MNRYVINKGLLLIVILSLSIIPVLGNDQDKGIEQPASSVNGNQDEQAIKNATLDKGEPLSKEELIKIKEEKEKARENITGAYNICSIGQAVDNTIVSWYSGNPDTGCGWYRQTTTYYYGGDAARSKAIPDNGRTGMTTQVIGPGTVSFYWKVGSEQNYDFLEFYIDGVLKDKISGPRSWQLKSYYITGSGIHAFKWIYRKDGNTRVLPDAGFVDKFVWTGNILLADALDINLQWLTYGYGQYDERINAKWFGQTRNSYDGGAAQSGSIGDNQRTILYTDGVIGPVKLSFWWRVISEQGYDFLSFYIDNQRQDYMSGNPGWRYSTYTLGPGSHILYWVYRKDGSDRVLPDMGWVDSVRLSYT